MRRLIHLLIFCMPTILCSQSLTFHDPAVQEAVLLLDEQQKEGIVSFEFIQHLSDYGLQNNEEPIRMIVSMLNLQPIGGVEAIRGVYAQNFKWQYDEATNTFLATQIGMLKKERIGEISIDVSAANAPNCQENGQIGFNVNIQPAPCMNGINEMDNDHTYKYSCLPALTTSLDELEALSVDIFPNPTVNFVNLELNKQIKLLGIEIIDIQGKLVENFQYKNTNIVQMDMRQFPAGTYSLQIKADKETWREKIVVTE